jgi:alkylation response protein AidB-like acyl-CoA dehydrogenase
MMSKLAQERLTQAVRSTVVAESAIEWTVDYTSQRSAFGKTIGEFQNTQFVLADLAAEITAVRCFVDRCIELFMNGSLGSVDAAKVKLLATNLHCKAVDQCLQFFGGYGYMVEYPIARAYIDARITRIAGGAAEVMKQIIGRELFKMQRSSDRED